MTYAQTNYFLNDSYEKVNNNPLLLVFGPQQIKTGAEWNTVFSVLSKKPSFLYGFNPVIQLELLEENLDGLIKIISRH